MGSSVSNKQSARVLAHARFGGAEILMEATDKTSLSIDDFAERCMTPAIEALADYFVEIEEALEESRRLAELNLLN